MLNIFNYMPVAGKLQHQIAYLAYAHTLLTYAHQSYLDENGVHILKDEQEQLATDIMLKTMEILEEGGWTYEHLTRVSTHEIRQAYNKNHIEVVKFFPTGSQYIPGYIALLMLLQVKKLKILEPIDSYVSDVLDYLFKAVPKEDRTKYAQCVKALKQIHRIK